MTTRAVYDGTRIVPTKQEAIDAFKATLSPGDAVAVTFEPWGKARTRLQQGLLHTLIGRYARAHMEPAPLVKVRWKVDLGYWLPADKLLSGEVELPSWRGAWQDMHEVYPELYPERTIAFVRSEATYTTRMEKEFIDYALTTCSENGVPVDDIITALQEVI